jgi:hypothetical protein
VDGFFRRHGGKAVLIGRFIGFLRWRHSWRARGCRTAVFWPTTWPGPSCGPSPASSSATS